MKGAGRAGAVLIWRQRRWHQPIVLILVTMGGLIGCGDNVLPERPLGDASVGNMTDAAVMDATDGGRVDGPMLSGILRAGLIPVDQGTIQIFSEGEVFADVTTSTTGEFSVQVPRSNADYEIFIPAIPGYWAHSSWILDVPEEGFANLQYYLTSDEFFEGFSNLLGEPVISKENGLVSLDIQGFRDLHEGVSFDIGTPGDPVFTVGEDGLPIRSDTLLNVSDSVLVFSNVLPQLLMKAAPNDIAAGCSQPAPPSLVRAGTVLTLKISCE